MKTTVTAQTECPLCGIAFDQSAIIASKRRTYCSRKCAGKAVRLGMISEALKTCPTCGHVGRRSVDLCLDHGPAVKAPSRVFTPDVDDTIRRRYPTEGSIPLAKDLGLSQSSVQNRAFRLGLKMTKEAYRATVHEAARAHMTTDNPMFREETKAKVAAWMEAHPDVAARVAWALSEGQGRFQRSRISSAERRLQRFLMELGVDFEPTFPFARNRFADARIGRLIIQCDGEYWHGHPRFEPLTERQAKQKGKDRESDSILRAAGFTVVRLWECDLSLERVAEVIRDNEDATRN